MAPMWCLNACDELSEPHKNREKKRVGSPRLLIAMPTTGIVSDPNRAPPACGGRGVDPWIRCGRKGPFPACVHCGVGTVATWWLGR